MRMSLEDIFLSLTTEDAGDARRPPRPPPQTRRPPMRNIVAIARKELKAYFASPIAYVVIGFFALLFGYFFYTLLWFFERQSMQVAPGARHDDEHQPDAHRPGVHERQRRSCCS